MVMMMMMMVMMMMMTIVVSIALRYSVCICTHTSTWLRPLTRIPTDSYAWAGLKKETLVWNLAWHGFSIDFRVDHVSKHALVEHVF